MRVPTVCPVSPSETLLTKQYVRVRAGMHGHPEYAVDTLAIARRILLLFSIAIVIWVFILVAAVGVKGSSHVAYAIFSTVFLLFTLGAPIALIVTVFKLRARVNACIRDLQQSR